MQLEQPGSALQRAQPAALNAPCARRALLPLAQVVQKGDPGLEPAGNPANVGLSLAGWAPCRDRALVTVTGDRPHRREGLGSTDGSASPRQRQWLQQSGAMNVAKALCPIRKALRSDLVLAAVVGLGMPMTFAGAMTQQSFPEGPPCPTSQLAPFGIAPTGARPGAQPAENPHCINPDGSQNGCLVTLKGYKWWTAYNYTGAYYNDQYYYNGGLGTSFAPEHAFVDSEGLHLKIDHDVWLGDPNNVPPRDQFPWTGAEAVLMFHDDSADSEANLGYGNYLVTVKLLKSTTSWNALDPNAALGVFPYERYGPPPAGAINCGANCPGWPSFGGKQNPYREIDLAEISRWGWNHGGMCPFTGTDGLFPQKTLCDGDAQFATQLVPKSAISVKRYDIGSTQVITLVMSWLAGGKPVIFEKYDGAVTFAQLDHAPTLPVVEWEQKKPGGTERFHDDDPNGAGRFHP